ncbi:galactose mutarotase [Sphingomonas sp. QA11]|uniref:aldose epimerase family protein n=1 Tax=Sphingomonas sp. QA11 TaxID=2950605 RepID=UPI0023496C37|nr:aldose epimerase family protein [Sphingomonas sp. QA11]WCM27036.1 galactose mutarotase [Sphingomonas sp. QA11]
MHKSLIMLAAIGTVAVAANAHAASAARETVGEVAGAKVEAITLANANGVKARILSYGATLQSLIAPDRNGKPADVVLGYDDLASYVGKPNFFGVTVGRYANRIAKGRFSIDGKTWQLPINNAPNSLHGGTKGFDKVVWRVVSVENGPVARVTFAYVSPDGDQGYPGKLDVTVIYGLDEKGSLSIEYKAATDKPTIVNMTNHAIFDLAGEGSPLGALGHKLTMPARAYTPVDATLIPTGELRPVEGSVFDFRKGRTLADGVRDGRDPQIVAGRGYDHNFAIDAGLTTEPKLAARLEDSESGRVLEVFSTEPGLQLYTGNFLDGTLIGKHGHVYRMGDGVAMEPQKFPDTPNQPAFGSARVDPGKPYRHLMIYRLSVAR